MTAALEPPPPLSLAGHASYRAPPRRDKADPARRLPQRRPEQSRRRVGLRRGAARRGMPRLGLGGEAACIVSAARGAQGIVTAILHGYMDVAAKRGFKSIHMHVPPPQVPHAPLALLPRHVAALGPGAVHIRRASPGQGSLSAGLAHGACSLAARGGLRRECETVSATACREPAICIGRGDGKYCRSRPRPAGLPPDSSLPALLLLASPRRGGQGSIPARDVDSA